MTDAAVFPGVLRSPTATVNPGRGRRGSVEWMLFSREWVVGGMAAVSRLLRITGRPAAASPDNRLESVVAVDMAVAAAVRPQLTKPGSISPQRQLALIMADRAVHDAVGVAVPAPVDSGWTPFLGNVDICPYRPIAGMGLAMTDEIAMKEAWEDDLSSPS